MTTTDVIPDERLTTAVAGLRELADFIEANPQFLAAIQTNRFLMYVDGGDFGQLVHALGGEREKSVTGDYFGVSRFFGGIELYLYADRGAVCEQVEVGTRKVEVMKDVCPRCAGLVEITPTGAMTCREFGSDHFRSEPPAKVIETIDEPVYEWKCAPVLDAVS